MIKIIYQILSELGLIFLYPISAIIIKLLPQKALQAKGSGKPLLIVERWMTVNIRHLYWKYYLQRQGFRVYILNLPLYEGRFEDSSRKLSRFINSKELSDVVLVGISSGALTSIMYLEELGGWDRVSKFVSIGAPFRGTWSAIFILFARSGWEMLPNSNFTKRIRAYKLKKPESVLCISARFDEMVPYGSSLSGAHKYTIDVVGHNNLHLRVKSTYKKIVEFASS